MGKRGYQDLFLTMVRLCFQDGDRAGVHDDTLLEDIQSKRQQTLYTQTGFAPAFKYEIAGLLDPE